MMLFALLALTFVPAGTVSTPPQPSELLGALPEGWRFERIDFPPSFAPELDFAGFEELAFAPGMFDPTSASHFSYALAIRLEADVLVDEEFLTSFLTDYFKGLCRSVVRDRERAGGSRPLDVDLERITATVVFAGRDYAAEVQLFDVFADGAPLELELQIAVQPGATRTELLGLAAPAGADAAVWRELLALGDRVRAGWSPEALLNHVYCVVDAETYAALAAEPFLRELAVCEERETVRTDLSYSGFYVYGHATYFEILPALPAAGRVEGAVGLALGLETPSATDAVRAALGASEITTFAPAEPRTRVLGTEPVPWFRILGVQAAHATARLQLFALEYDPRFLARWHAQLAPVRPWRPDPGRPDPGRREPGKREPADSGLARRDVLERYAAVLDQSELRASAALADVTEVRLALDDEERAYCERALTSLGWVAGDAGTSRVLDGPGVRVVCLPPSSRTELVLDLRREVLHEPLVLGRARMTFDGRQATLSLPER